MVQWGLKIIPCLCCTLKKKKKNVSRDQPAYTNSTLSGQGPVHNGSAQWDDCGPTFPVELWISSFPWWIPTLCLNSIVDSPQLHWVKGVCTFSCNCQLHFWKKSQGLLHATAVTQGWNGHWNKCQQRKLTGEENYPVVSARDWTHNFLTMNGTVLLGYIPLAVKKAHLFRPPDLGIFSPKTNMDGHVT